MCRVKLTQEKPEEELLLLPEAPMLGSCFIPPDIGLPAISIHHPLANKENFRQLGYILPDYFIPDHRNVIVFFVLSRSTLVIQRRRP